MQTSSSAVEPEPACGAAASSGISSDAGAGAGIPAPRSAFCAPAPAGALGVEEGGRFARAAVAARQRQERVPEPAPEFPARWEAAPQARLGQDSAIPEAFKTQPVTTVDGQTYVLPEQFGVVETGVYRCAFPFPAAFPFLRRLGIRTIINLLDAHPGEYAAFVEEQGINYLALSVRGNKSTCADMDIERVRRAMVALMDSAAHPVLIHCRSGKHRTGTVVGCMRMLQGHSLESACNEYIEFCAHKQRELDKEYIERFDPREMASLAPPRERWPAWMPADALQRLPAIEAAGADGVPLSPRHVRAGSGSLSASVSAAAAGGAAAPAAPAAAASPEPASAAASAAPTAAVAAAFGLASSSSSSSVPTPPSERRDTSHAHSVGAAAAAAGAGAGAGADAAAACMPCAASLAGKLEALVVATEAAAGASSAAAAATVATAPAPAPA